MSANTDYVQSVIGMSSGTVGWGEVELQLAVDDAVEFYGVSTEAEATDTTKLNILLRLATWIRVRNQFAFDHDYKADGESFSRSQMFSQINQMVAEAKKKAIPYLTDSEIDIQNLDVGYSPYLRSS